MYKSPIDIISAPIKEYKLDTDKMVIEAVFKTGINVDKDELIRALQYDRGQYDKGYADGKAEVAMEIFEEIERIFERLKTRECSNAVCCWCAHADTYGRRAEECDKPYIDKNGKEQRACFGYAKFESYIDNCTAELKKKYTEGEI